MYQNDTITLFLEGFASASGTDSAFAIPDARVAFGSWVEARNLLVLTISAPRLDGTFTVDVPVSAGILVPLRGVLPSGNNYYANSSAAAGPVTFFRDITCQVNPILTIKPSRTSSNLTIRTGGP